MTRPNNAIELRPNRWLNTDVCLLFLWLGKVSSYQQARDCCADSTTWAAP
jgi:hypothetical protein